MHRGDGGRPGRPRARGGVHAAPLDRPDPRRRRPRARADARPSRGSRARRLPEGGRRRPGQPGARPRPAPGRRAAPRRDNGTARRRPQRLADHGDPDRRRLRRCDAAPRPARRAARGDPRLGCPGSVACGRDARGGARGGAPGLEQESRPCRGARARGARPRLRDRGRGPRRSGRRLHVHRRPGADRRPLGSGARRARERRRLVRAVGTRARGGRRRGGLPLRRPTGVDGQRVGRLPRSRRGARDRARPHRGRARRAARRLARRTAVGRGADALQVARARGRGPGRRRRSASTSRASGASASRSRSDRARRDRAGAQRHRRLRADQPARAARGRRSLRDLAQARVPAADRVVQAPRRDERHPAGRSGRVARRRVDDERREHGPGGLLGRAGARRAGHGRRSRPRASRQARRGRAPRRAHDHGPVRHLVGDDGGRRVSRASTGSSSTRCSTSTSWPGTA